MPIYNLNNKRYNIPDDVVADFERDNPEAIVSYSSGDKVYDIPVNKRDRFLKKYPDAKPYADNQTESSKPYDHVYDENMNLVGGAAYDDITKGSYKQDPKVRQYILDNKPDMFKPKTVDMYGAHDKEKSEFDLMNEGKLYQMKAMRAASTIGEQLDERIKANESALNEARKKQAEGKLQSSSNDRGRYSSVGLGGTIKERQEAYEKSYGKSPSRVEQTNMDDDVANLLAEQEYLKESKKVFDAAKNDSGFFQGMKDAIDASYLSFGLTDMLSAERISVVQQKLESGQALTDSEQSLLTSLGLQQMVNEQYNDLLGRWYKAGMVTAEMAPFMAEMAVNPLSGLGKSAMKWTVKKFGEKGAKAIAVKVLSRTIGDAVGAEGMAFTTGMPGVAADALERQRGYVTTELGDKGTIKGVGFKGGEKASDAWGKALTARTIENWSEMVGEYFSPVGKAVGKGFAKAFDKMGLSKVNDFIDNINSSEWVKLLDDFSERTQWNGPLGEFAEEQVGMIANAALVGDTKWSDITDLDKQLDVALGVGVFGTAMSLLRIGGYRTPKYRARKAVEGADKEGAKLYGEELWETVKFSIDNSSDEELGNVLATMIAATGANQEQAEAAFKYANALKAQQAVNTVKEKAKIDMPGDMEVEAEAAYDEGSELETPLEKHEAKRTVDRAERALGVGSENSDEQQFAQMVMNGVDSPVETVNAMAEQGYTEEQIQKAKDYYTAVHRMNGLTDALLDKVDSQIESANAEVDANTNKDNGSVTKVILRDGREGYVVEGSVVRGEEGRVDVNNSDDTVMVRLQNGEVKMMNPNKDIYAVAWIDSPEQVKEEINVVLREDLINQAIGEIDWNPATPNPKVGDSFEINGVPVVVAGMNENGLIVVLAEEWQKAQGKKDYAFQSQYSVPVSEYKNWASAQLDAQQDAQAMAQEEVIKENLTTEAQQPIEEKRPMTDDEAAEFIFQMERNAVEAPEIELTPENWIAEFGEDGLVETPIGQVKFGQSQYLKLQQQGRNGKLGMIRPTLTNPDIIIEDASNAKEGDTAERGSSYVFIKAFKGKDGKRVYYFTSITIKKDGLEVVVSNQEKRLKQIQDLMMRGKLLWNRFESDSDSSGKNQAFSSATTENPNSGQPGSTAQSVVQSVSDAQIEESVPLNDSNKRTSTDNQSAWLGINSSELSTNKDSDKNVQSQENKAKPFYEREKEEVFRELREMYGEKMPHKVEVTAKAWADKVKKAQKKVDETQQKLDDAPIGEDAKQKAARDKAKTELEAIRKEADFWDEMDAEIKNAKAKREAVLNPKADVVTSTEPMTTDEFIAQQLAAGNIVLSKEDYMAQTGYGNEEVKSMNGGAQKLITNNGMTLDAAGERLMEMDRENGTNFFNQDDATAGRDALIALLGSVRTRKELNQYIAENRKAQAKKESEAIRNASEEYVMSGGYESLEDYLDQMEAAEVENPFLEDRADEIMAIFAEEAAKYEQSINNTENGQGTENEAPEGSDTVLPEESSDNTGGIETDNESASAGNGIDEEGEGTYEDEQANEVEPSQSRILDVFNEASRIAAKNRREQIKARVRMWEAAGVKVKVHERTSGIHNMDVRRAIMSGEIVAGWYDGEAHVYLPHIDSLAELDRTILHEAISHMGIKELMGKENFDKLCDKVWEMMPQSAKDEFINYPGVNGNTRAAADEYMAHLAEDENLSPEEKTLWQKIVQWFKDLFTTKVDEKEQAVSILNQSRLTNKDISELLKLSYANLKSNAAERIEENVGEVDAEKGDVRFAVRDVLKGEEREQAIKDLMAVTGRSRRTVVKWLKAEESLASVILNEDNVGILDMEADESVPSIWKNSDYPQGTVEFSNICKKRLPFTTIYQRLQKEFPDTLFDAQTLNTIRNTMKEMGEDVACALCFVEDRRQLLGEIGQGFIDAVKGMDVEVNDNQKVALDKLRESGDKYVPNLFDIITLDGMKELRKKHPAVAQAFIEYNNARGMQSGRLFQAYSAYNREILKYNKKKVESINNNGGLRIFSFSDFEAHHLIDLVQVLTDCAAKGLKVQGYTKVPEFAKAVKDTNAKINRSLIPKGVGYVDADYVPEEGEAVSPNVINGKRLLFDTIEGIDVNNPNFFDSTGSKSVGNILVAINDEHARLAMADPFVDYIIGFHTGQSKAILKGKGIDTWVNYKNEQLDKEIVTDESGNQKMKNAPHHGLNIYTDVLNVAEAEGNPIKTAKQFTERFLEECAKRGYVPRFSRFLNRAKDGRFLYTPGYHKFLIDFKLFDKNGRILPQEAVVPKFDDAFNKQILDDYVKGVKEEIPNDAVYEAVKEAVGLGEGTRFRFSKSPEEFDAIQKEAVEKKGIVMPGLNEAVLNVVDVPRHDFTGTGNEAIAKARKWASLNIEGEHTANIGTPEEFKYIIDNKSIKKYLSSIAIGLSDNLGVHLAVLKMLPNVINESIEAEIHADYKKSDERSIENGIDKEDLLIHRLYGAVMVDNKLHRVKTTMKEKKNDGIKPYTYEVTKIELIDGSSQNGTSMSNASNNSISAAKLLNGVEKSYDKGKYLLDKSEKTRFRVANKNQAIFVSNAQKAVEGIKQEKGTPKQWLAMIEKNGGLKAGEDKWLGLSDWLKSLDKKSVAKAEILEFINQNKIRIEEVRYAGSVENYSDFEPLIADYKGVSFRDSFFDAFDVEFDEFYISNEQEAVDLYNKENGTNMSLDEYGYLEERDEETLIEWAQSVMSEAREASGVNPISSIRLEYTTEGLENKAEIALTVPTIEPWGKDDEVHFGDAGEGRAVAWIRFGETKDSEGNKVLVIDEIQSKRHQEGREKGYRTKEQQKLYDLTKKYEDAIGWAMSYETGLERKYKKSNITGVDITNEEEADTWEDLWRKATKAQKELDDYRKEHPDVMLNGQAIPEAPFEKNWSELAFKRMLRYAAENGFDKVAWTTGEQQAKRYSLRNVVDSIAIAKSKKNEGSYYITSYDKADMPIDVVSGNKTPEELKELFGKAVADELIQGVENLEDGRDTFILEGAGLEVGGEGMKGFYDKMLPSFVNKYVKKWGTKVQDIELPNVEEAGRIMHSVDVTDAMKESVMEGQTMFRISEKGKRIQTEVDKFTAKYDSKEVVVVEVSSMSDKEIEDMFNSPADEVREAMDEGLSGGYNLLTDKIYIFVDNQSLDELEETMFHENMHPSFHGDKMIGAFDEAVKDNTKKMRASLRERGYREDEIAEEVFVRITTDALLKGDFKNIEKYLPEEYKEDFYNKLKEFGYDTEEKIGRRTGSDNQEVRTSRSEEQGASEEVVREGRAGQYILSGRRDSGRSDDSENGPNGSKRAALEEVRNQAEQIGKLLDQVADMGLEGVIGNAEYNRLMLDIFHAMPKDIHGEISVNAVKNLNLDVAKAVSDYLGANDNPSVWEKVVGMVRDALRKVGFDLELTPNDVKYMLWRSKKPLNRRQALDVAEDIAKRSEFGVGEDSGTRFRTKKAVPFDPSDKRDKLVKAYDAFLKTGKFNFIEAFQDRMYSVKVMMDMIVDVTGKKVRDFEDAYTAENQLGSINKPEEERYLKDFYKPLVEVIRELSDKYGREVVERYIYCKSGLERNEVLRQRDADEAYNDAKAELDDKLAKGQLTQPQYDALLQQADDQRQKTLAEDVDYSGIRGMLYNVKAQAINKDYEENRIDKATRDARLAQLEANKKDEVKDWKQFAEDQVAALEAPGKASKAELDKLWKKINAATNETLRMDYESGMIDKETYDAEKNMMKYYVPLRNWADTTAEEMYEYRSELVRPVSSNQKRAKGRESQADNPIATIALMAQNAIVRGNRNKVKQKFYAFVANRETGLASVRDVWYEKDSATGDWTPKYADTSKAKDAAEFAQILDDFENSMKLLEEQGLAYKGKLPFGMKFRASRQQKMAHVVPVMINGKEYAVYVNGNPRPAQAINGETNSEAANASAWYDKIKRIYGAGLTSWNPDFIIPNMIRDGIHASTMTFLDAGPWAAIKFAANGPRAFGQVFAMVSGVKKHWVNPKYQAYFEEFVANGGETGYTAIHTLEDYKKEYDKLMKDVKGLKGKNLLKGGLEGAAKWLEAANRIFEDVNRFNAYVSARESGESIMRSVNAAKNITVNFNRKGALSANNTTFGIIANAMSKWILFFNPAVQGLAQLVTKTKVNKKRAAMMASTILASGFFMPMFNEALVAAAGDDEEDDYWNQSDFKRRNNWLFFTGDGYVSVPLPPVLRELYGIGDIIYGSITGRIPAERAVMDMARQIQSAIGFINLIPEVSQEPDAVTWAKGFAPDVAAPILDVLSNTNFMGRPIAKWTDFNKYDPEYERVYKGVSPQWVELSKMLNEMGGQEGRRSDVWGNFINPAMMEHLFTSYGGGIGKTINNLAGMALDAMEGNTENLDPYRKSPIAPRFYIPNDEKTVVPGINRKYYDYDYKYNIAKKAYKNYQEGVRSKEHPEWQKYINEMNSNGELRFIQFFEQEAKKVKKLQNLIKEEPKNKKELEDKLIDVKAEIAVKCYEMLK